MKLITALTVVLGCAVSGCAVSHAASDARTPRRVDTSARAALLRHAQVWRSTHIASMDLRRGPQGAGAFAPGARVTCDFVERDLSGKSPKFACRIGADDEVKVKFGGANGEVYGELLATRLLWALGFGADRMYSVNVICRGCPREFAGIERTGNESRFAPAVIERKMPGAEWDGDEQPGWGWDELDLIDPRIGGAPRAQRDALKLLAVMLQHTDSKRVQQRIVCLGVSAKKVRNTCARPFLMISDVGLTFGRANWMNANDHAAVNLVEWQRTPVWREDGRCVGNLPKSFTGTLRDPVISEAGRRFLASLLMQLSDRQLRDLFEASQVRYRLRNPLDVSSGFPTVDEWVTAFKQKRQDIAARRCA